MDIKNDVSGFCQRGGTFVGAGLTTDSYDIQDIVPQKPSNAATELEDAGAVIQEINDYGAPITTYHYFLAGSPSTSGSKAGWYYLDDATSQQVYATKVFAPGEGFLYQAPYFEDENEEEVGSYLEFAE